MVNSSRSFFKRAGEYCNYCYLDNLGRIDKKENKFKKSAKNSLENIIEFNGDKKNREMVEEALKKCEKCDYTNNEVFQYLESKDIKF